MLKTLLSYFSPSTQPPSTLPTTQDTISPERLVELRKYLTELEQSLQTFEPDWLGERLFEAILEFMVKIRHYPPEKIDLWRKIHTVVFDTHYIHELKNTARVRQYGSLSHIFAVESYAAEKPALPFMTLESLIEIVRRCQHSSSVKDFTTLVSAAELFDNTTCRLIGLKYDEKLALIALLQEPDYPAKYEMMLDKHVQDVVNDKGTFVHFVENTLSFTDIDFFLKAKSVELPVAVTAPIVIGRSVVSNPTTRRPLLFACHSQKIDDDDDFDLLFDLDDVFSAATASADTSVHKL